MSIAEHVTGLQHLGLPTAALDETAAFYESLGFVRAHSTVNPGTGSGVLSHLRRPVHRNLRVRRARPAGPEPSTTWPWTWTTLSPPGRKCGWPAWPRWKMPFSSSPSGRTACAFSTYWAPTERRWSSARGCRPRSVWLRLVSSAISDSFLCAKLENLPDPLAKGPLYRL